MNPRKDYLLSFHLFTKFYKSNYLEPASSIEIRIVNLTTGTVIRQGPPDALHCAYVTWDNFPYEPLYRFDPTTQEVQTRFPLNAELSDEDRQTLDQWVQELRPNDNSYDVKSATHTSN
jgi:hypothetical protein